MQKRIKKNCSRTHKLLRSIGVLKLRKPISFLFVLVLGVHSYAADQTTSQNSTQEKVQAAAQSAAVTDPQAATKKFLTDYAALAYQGYSSSAQKVRELQSALTRFLKTPSPEGLKFLQRLWVASKSAYMPTEVFRFYEGPIDGETGPEAFVNSWPLDEAYIDYVNGDEKAGIINRPDLYPEITEQLLLSLNEKNGETNITTGFHAIEFLLWGQDLSATSAGQRSYEDYVLGKGQNAARRRTYLKVAVELLAQALEKVAFDWKSDYREEFLAPQNQLASMKKVVHALIKLSGEELSQERMFVAVDAQSQEDEHSCFSDTTWLDLQLDFLGLKNVIMGSPNRLGLLQVLKANRVNTSALENKMQQAEIKLKNVPQPFDQSILNRQGQTLILDAVSILEDLSEELTKATTQAGI